MATWAEIKAKRQTKTWDEIKKERGFSEIPSYTPPTTQRSLSADKKADDLRTTNMYTQYAQARKGEVAQPTIAPKTSTTPITSYRDPRQIPTVALPKKLDSSATGYERFMAPNLLSSRLGAGTVGTIGNLVSGVQSVTGAVEQALKLPSLRKEQPELFKEYEGATGFQRTFGSNQPISKAEVPTSKPYTTLGNIAKPVDEYSQRFRSSYEPKNKVEQFIGSGIESLPLMASAVATGGATLPLIGLSGGGAEYKQALERGATPQQAFSSSVFSGAAEAIPEAISLPNITKIFKQPANNLLKKGIGLLVASGGEGISEGATNVLSFLGRKVTYDENGVLDWKDVANDALLGSTMGLFLGGVGNLSPSAINAMKKGEVTVEDINNIIQEEKQKQPNNKELNDLELSLQQLIQESKIKTNLPYSPKQETPITYNESPNVKSVLTATNQISKINDDINNTQQKLNELQDLKANTKSTNKLKTIDADINNVQTELNRLNKYKETAQGNVTTENVNQVLSELTNRSNEIQEMKSYTDENGNITNVMPKELETEWYSIFDNIQKISEAYPSATRFTQAPTTPQQPQAQPNTPTPQETAPIEPQTSEKAIQPKLQPIKPQIPLKAKIEPTITMAEDVGLRKPILAPASLEVKEGTRKTFPSIQQSEAISKEAKATMNANDFTYEQITNEETLAKARKDLGTVDDFLKKSVLKDATDTARGIELMRIAAKDGDFTTFNNLALKQAELMTKAGQTVQAQAMLKKMTPEGYLQYIVKEVDAQNKTVKQKQGQADIDELQNAIDNATPEQLSKIKKILEKRKIKYDELTPTNIKEYIEQIKKQSGVIDINEGEMQYIYDKIVESLNLEGRQKDVAIAEAYKILEDKIPPRSTDTISALQRISMLLNIRTQARNVTGNALMQMAEISKEAIGIPVDILTSKITGERTITPYNRSDLSKAFKGAKKGYLEAWEDYQKGINTRRDSGQFEISNKKSFPTNTKYKVLNVTNKYLNKANDLTSFLLSAGDRPFFEATYAMEKSRLERLPQYKDKADVVDKKAIEVAEERTFQNRSQLAQSAIDIRNKAGIFGRLVLPYAYTPANITDKVFDYSPLGSIRTISKNLVSDVKKGEFNQREFADRLSRNLTGSAILLLGYTLAKNGIISGAYSDDGDEREFQKSIGMQDYAFKVGDYQVNFDWAQPIAVPLATGANLYQQGLTETTAKENIFNKLGQVSLESTKTLLEQPLLQGVQDLFGGYGSEGIITNVANIAKTAPLQVVPGLSLLRQTRQTVDPKIRNVDYNSLFDQLRNQLPGLSQTLPFKYSTLGEEQEYSGGIVSKFASPATVTKMEPSKLEKEILETFRITGDKDVFPKKAPKYFSKNKVRYDLTLREQSEFQNVMGDYVKQSLEKLMATDNYDNLKPERKSALMAAIIADSYDFAKAEYLNGK